MSGVRALSSGTAERGEPPARGDGMGGGDSSPMRGAERLRCWIGATVGTIGGNAPGGGVRAPGAVCGAMDTADAASATAAERGETAKGATSSSSSMSKSAVVLMARASRVGKPRPRPRPSDRGAEGRTTPAWEEDTLFSPTTPPRSAPLRPRGDTFIASAESVRGFAAVGSPGPLAGAAGSIITRSVRTRPIAETPNKRNTQTPSHALALADVCGQRGIFAG